MPTAAVMVYPPPIVSKFTKKEAVEHSGAYSGTWECHMLYKGQCTSGGGGKIRSWKRGFKRYGEESKMQSTSLCHWVEFLQPTSSSPGISAFLMNKQRNVWNPYGHSLLDFDIQENERVISTGPSLCLHQGYLQQYTYSLSGLHIHQACKISTVLVCRTSSHMLLILAIAAIQNPNPNPN